jgi:hypothetical protein
MKEEAKVYEEIINYSIDNKKSITQSICDLLDRRIETLEKEIVDLKRDMNNSIDDLVFSGDEAKYKEL